MKNKRIRERSRGEEISISRFSDTLVGLITFRGFEMDFDKMKLYAKQQRLVKIAVVLVAVALTVKKVLGFLAWRRKIIETLPGSSNPSALLGDLPLLIEKGFTDEFFIGLHEKYGDIVRIFLMPNMVNVSIANAAMTLELYSKTRSRAKETYNLLFYLGKQNLLFQHGEMVKKLRMVYGRMISSKQQLRSLHQISFRRFEVLTNEWSKKQEFDLHKEIAHVLYDVMGETLFGFSWSTSDIGKHIRELHMYLIHNVGKWLLWPFRPIFLASYREFESNMHSWYNLCWKLIEERKQAIETDPKTWENDESALTVLCTAKDEKGNPFFDKKLAISTMCGFLNGAFDTTHSTLYWLMFCLASYPDIQQKVREEIYSCLEGKDGCSVEDVRAMEYLDCVLKESMRLHATVPINQRCNYESDITVNGFTIPKGTNINFITKATMRDERFFGPNVNDFVPERFMGDSDASTRAKRHNIVFGAYNRMCVGETFAKVELKAFAVVLLKSYSLEFADSATISDEGFMEAGVTQPKTKALFKTTPLSSA